jgi:hypothetical protein
MPTLKVKKHPTANEPAATHPEVPMSSGSGGGGASNLKRPFTFSKWALGQNFVVANPMASRVF